MELSKPGVLLRQSAAVVNWTKNQGDFFIAGHINFIDFDLVIVEGYKDESIRKNKYQDI